MVSPSLQTRGHPYKLFKPRCGGATRRNFFCRKSYKCMEFSVDFTDLLNMVCIDLWLCLLFYLFLNAVYVIQTLCEMY